MQHTPSNWPRTLLFILSASLPSAVISGCASDSPSKNTQGPHAFPNSLDYYPEKAKRLGLTGRVGLEASCEKGHFKDVVILESAGPILDAGAMKLFADGHCTPGNPPETRTQIGVIFQLTGKSKVQPFEDHRPTIVVTAIGLPRG
jgi:outer membrane biosynthesis protein TonB